jgi:hypothetical protein
MGTHHAAEGTTAPIDARIRCAVRAERSTPVATYEFLSPEWITAANAARARHLDRELPFALAMNLTVTEVPFGDGVLDAHVSASSGSVTVDFGHLDVPEVSVTLDYVTARSVLVNADGEAAMAAFMEGRVRVEGDMTKLLAFQSRAMTEGERDLHEEIKELTAS